jgi:hypothetical protein
MKKRAEVKNAKAAADFVFVQLYAGSLREKDFITYLEMPVFPKLPDVLIWAERVFKLKRRDLNQPVVNAYYVEASLWHAPPESEYEFFDRP